MRLVTRAFANNRSIVLLSEGRVQANDLSLGAAFFNTVGDLVAVAVDQEFHVIDTRRVHSDDSIYAAAARQTVHGKGKTLVRHETREGVEVAFARLLGPYIEHIVSRELGV